MSLLYHEKHRVVSCVCGILISGKHECKIPLSQVKVEDCYWFTRGIGKPCKICAAEEKLKDYKNQWTEDDSGYCVCRECEAKTQPFLPKECFCNAFIDTDGETKCKKCKEIWSRDLDLHYDPCEKCGYENC